MTDARDVRIAELERALRASEDRLQGSLRFTELFARLIGHELRNPLSVVATAAGLLQLRADSDKIAKPVARIVVSADRLERMIAQLVDVTRVRLGAGLPLAAADVDLATVAGAIADEVQAATGVVIPIAVTGDARGCCDRELIAQLLSILIGNACQHGTAGTATLTIDGSDPATIRIEVGNDGAIPAAILPVLFEPLRAGDGRERRARASGLGFGLYLARQIALAHRGTIRAESIDDARTRVVVELPRASTPPTLRVVDAGVAAAER